jgi:hypothetical protein
VTDPDAAARKRVGDVLERFARVGLQVVVLAPPDATRIMARERARDAAVDAGRGELLDEAAAAARETTLRAFARAGFSGTWAATDMSVSVASASDRVAAAAALEEAAMAAVVEDLVDDETLEVLKASSNELVRSSGVPPPGSLSALASPTAFAIHGPLQVAALVAFVVACAAIWLTVGAGAGFTALVLGLALAGGFARWRSRPDS